MKRRIPRAPSGVVELIRLLVIVFFAGVGYEVARQVVSGDNVLGPFNGITLGVIVGSGIGYVLGGVVGRTTITAVDRTERSLADVSAEQLVAGSIGGVIGVLVAGGLAWPVFLIGEPFLAFPLFAFVVVVLGLIGFRVGQSKREGVLGMFGEQAGLKPRATPASALPRILDTSVAIDGRLLDVVRAGFLHGRILVPSPVLGELQGLADSADERRRARGRRGLELLETLRREPAVDVDVLTDEVPDVPDVDGKLIRLCLDKEAALLTLDTNLARVASLAGVKVLNLHALALALRPPVSAGDEVSVLLIKQGKEAGQAVGYFDDGTMVVVERGRSSVGHEVMVRVISVLTTANGRMVFAQPVESVERNLGLARRHGR
ncbi:MAG: PIN/TRAM domain-containing protein [Actinomycetes bacterium]